MHGLFQDALKAPHLVPMKQPNLEVPNFEDLQVGWVISQFAATCRCLNSMSHIWPTLLSGWLMSSSNSPLATVRSEHTVRR